MEIMRLEMSGWIQAEMTPDHGNHAAQAKWLVPSRDESGSWESCCSGRQNGSKQRLFGAGLSSGKDTAESVWFVLTIKITDIYITSSKQYILYKGSPNYLWKISVNNLLTPLCHCHWHRAVWLSGVDDTAEILHLRKSPRNRNQMWKNFNVLV